LSASERNAEAGGAIHMRRIVRKAVTVCVLGISAVALGRVVSAQLKGPSTQQTAYVLPEQPTVSTKSILSVGDVIHGYRMVGIPDGLGAFDNGDDTFTLLMNHELTSGAGVVRAHGGKGAFVSKWIINRADLSVVSGADLMQQVFLWDAGTQKSFAAPAAF